MFSFFRKKPPAPPAPEPAAGAPAAPSPTVVAQPPRTQAPAPAPAPKSGGLIGTALVAPLEIPLPPDIPPERQNWLNRLSTGLRNTGSNLSQVFTGAQIDDALYEEL
jgi:fused signal recognition particle receptor